MNENDIFSDSTAEDLHTIILDENEMSLHIGESSIIGRRKDQQDTIMTDDSYHYLEEKKAISILCDGMGGLSGGKKASSLCSSIIYDAYHGQKNIESIPAFYKSMIAIADNEVNNLRGEDGQTILGAGTTLTSVIIEEDNLYWASVGDSHIYIIRGQQILCITNEHNYLMLLNERVARGEITREEADSDPKKEALISYIGVGGVKYIDINIKPFKLLNGDYVILCSDGLYRSLTNEEIMQTALRYGENTQLAADTLTQMALNKNYKNQDNTSVIVINFKNQG